MVVRLRDPKRRRNQGTMKSTQKLHSRAAERSRPAQGQAAD
jgi:hypothetical protein